MRCIFVVLLITPMLFTGCANLGMDFSQFGRIDLCHGTGRIKCLSCFGTGYETKYDTTWAPGTSWTPARAVTREVKTMCWSCFGQGWKTCYGCYGCQGRAHEERMRELKEAEKELQQIKDMLK